MVQERRFAAFSPGKARWALAEGRFFEVISGLIPLGAKSILPP